MAKLEPDAVVIVNQSCVQEAGAPTQYLAVAPGALRNAKVICAVGHVAEVASPASAPA
jgi:hypothetical protein